jgi:hypothetical protein
MLLDYEIAGCTRRCATSGRAIAPGEEYCSTLELERGATVRRDYGLDSWQGPPENVVAWWRSRLDGDGARAKLAPQDVLLNLFAALADEPVEAEFRYLLGLLLLRRRLVKLDQTRSDVGGDVLLLDCPRREEQFELRVTVPDATRSAELERRLIDLVYGGT